MKSLKILHNKKPARILIAASVFIVIFYCSQKGGVNTGYAHEMIATAATFETMEKESESDSENMPDDSGPSESGSGDESDVFDEFDEFEPDSDFDEFKEFDSGADKPGAKVYDPLAGYNRFMTKVNDRVYFWILKPAASGYAAVTPGFVRKSVNRFFKNLSYPVRFVNNVLQLKLKKAGVETARFAINSTVGIAGLGDPANRWFDLEAYPEDFGQTLGVYGVGEGFHLVLPLLGPSNLRDAFAIIPDRFLKPLYYVEPAETGIALGIYDRVNYTSLHLGEYESLKKDAVDWYIFLRNAYESNRKKKIEE
ncbi:MAG: VacJ family lipoprotein [Desulfobacterales bacterium]